jgi:hypothetical protein
VEIGLYRWITQPRCILAGSVEPRERGSSVTDSFGIGQQTGFRDGEGRDSARTKQGLHAFRHRKSLATGQVADLFGLADEQPEHLIADNVAQWKRTADGLRNS